MGNKKRKTAEGSEDNQIIKKQIVIPKRNLKPATILPDPNAKTVELNKRQKMRMAGKKRKQIIKEKLISMKAGRIPINVDDISEKIKLLETDPTLLSLTGKRRLRSLRKLKKISNNSGKDELKVASKTVPEKEQETTLSKKRRERRNKKNGEVVNDQKLQNKLWEADTKKSESRINKIFSKPRVKEDVSIKAEQNLNDSDYEVEHIVKPDEIVKKLKNEDWSDEDICEHDFKPKKKIKKENKKVNASGNIQSTTDNISDTDNEVSLETDNKESSQDELLESDNIDTAESKSVDMVGDIVDNYAKTPYSNVYNNKSKKQLNLLTKNKEDELKKKQKQVKLGPGDISLLMDVKSKTKVRYVVFVGNLPYTTEKKELEEHFAKAGEVRDVRIPSIKGSNKPRGFAYVEMTNEDGYQRALSLHHTSVGGRRINVNYTQTGKKKPEERKKIVKEKNMKLDAMRKRGLLAGSLKMEQKRSFRRNKEKKAEQ